MNVPLTFPDTQSGDSITQTVTITNTGGGTLIGSATSTFPFTIFNGSYSLTAGQSQNVLVTFAPSNAGTFQNTITFTDNGGNASTTASGDAVGYFVVKDSLSGRLTNLVIDSSTLFFVNPDGISGAVESIGIDGNSFTILAANLDHPGGLAVDSSFVYWYEGPTGSRSLVRVPRAGGTRSTICDGLWFPQESLVCDATKLYFIDANRILSVSNAPASAPSVLFSSTNLPSPAVCLNASELFFFDGSNGQITKIAVTGGTSTQIASASSARAIAADSSFVYWTDPIAGTLCRASRGGGGVTTLASGLNQPAGLCVDGTNAYVTLANNSVGGVLIVPFSGSKVVTIGAHSSSVGIVRDAFALYWNDSISSVNCRVLKCMRPGSGSSVPADSGSPAPAGSSSVFAAAATPLDTLKTFGFGQAILINDQPATRSDVALTSPNPCNRPIALLYFSDQAQRGAVAASYVSPPHTLNGSIAQGGASDFELSAGNYNAYLSASGRSGSQLFDTSDIDSVFANNNKFNFMALDRASTSAKVTALLDQMLTDLPAMGGIFIDHIEPTANNAPTNYAFPFALHQFLISYKRSRVERMGIEPIVLGNFFSLGQHAANGYSAFNPSAFDAVVVEEYKGPLSGVDSTPESVIDFHKTFRKATIVINASTGYDPPGTPATLAEHQKIREAVTLAALVGGLHAIDQGASQHGNNLYAMDHLVFPNLTPGRPIADLVETTNYWRRDYQTMIAVIARSSTSIALPNGQWRDFWTGSAANGTLNLTSGVPYLLFLDVSSSPTIIVSPSVSVSPMMAPVGTSFGEPGNGFTRNGRVTLHFMDPNGTVYLVSKTADTTGAYSHSYRTNAQTIPGLWRYWATDESTKTDSQIVTFRITRPTVTVDPTAVTKGMAVDEPGSGFSINSTATLHFVDPSGTHYTESKPTTATGSYAHSYTTGPQTLSGTWSYWATDDTTGTNSETVHFQVQ